ncbi:MAG: hypothetical protein XD74_1042, partial [Actinobacteria bacterium 66_15]
MAEAARVVEAYVGEYASGKSENAVNRAISLLATGQPVTIADLDLVEPCYTLRPLKKRLQALGLTVLAWDTGDTVGMGEAGQTIMPQVRWVLRRAGHIVLDVGYGVHGAGIINLVEGAAKDKDLRVLLV